MEYKGNIGGIFFFAISLEEARVNYICMPKDSYWFNFYSTTLSKLVGLS